MNSFFEFLNNLFEVDKIVVVCAAVVVCVVASSMSNCNSEFSKSAPEVIRSCSDTCGPEGVRKVKASAGNPIECECN